MMSSASSKSSLGLSLRVALFRLRVFFVGLALDFWKDGPWPGFSLGKRSPVSPSSTPKKERPRKKKPKEASSSEEMAEEAQAELSDVMPVREPTVWNGDRVAVIEHMWGEGHALPGGDEYLNSLSSPLGINSEMSILDLSAGLGDMARSLAEEYKTYVTGMEVDSALAARGMVMSIAAGKSKSASVVAYDPANFTASRKYDCIFARELFYKIIGKEKFFKAIDSSLKSGGGQIVFTDYILDPAVREKPAIARWLAREPNAAPLSSIEMIKMWKGMGYDLRIAEDQTQEYKVLILQGLKSFVDFMIMNRPDEATKLCVVREVDLWVRRMEAFSQGLKYYRFYGIRH
ncbi:MAG: cyclopropane-fatty-acyl-phospholipid synthase family protein [Bdellovibrionales bacterium]